MICVIQRVRSARVVVDGAVVGAIEEGLLALIAVLPDDERPDVEYIAERLQNLRIFADDAGRMNLSVQDTKGSLLLVSQFTLAADVHRGRRPSFSAAAAPEDAERLFGDLVEILGRSPISVQTGEFAADMQVELINDGPVTFILDSKDRRGGALAAGSAPGQGRER